MQECPVSCEESGEDRGRAKRRGSSFLNRVRLEGEIEVEIEEVDGEGDDDEEDEVKKDAPEVEEEKKNDNKADKKEAMDGTAFDWKQVSMSKTRWLSAKGDTIPE